MGLFRQVPEAQTPRWAAGQRLRTIRGEGDAPDLLALARGERTRFLARLDVPDTDDAVRSLILAAARDELLVARTERDADDGIGMPLQRAQPLAVSHIPDADRVIVAAGRRAGAVAGERDGVHLAGVTVEPADRLARCHIPEADTMVVACGQELPPVGRESGSRDVGRVADEPAQFLAGVQVPHAQRGIVAAGDERLAVGREGHAA